METLWKGTKFPHQKISFANSYLFLLTLVTTLTQCSQHVQTIQLVWNNKISEITPV